MASTTVKNNYDYDFAVIGGGSGGIAAAKESARLGQRVVLLDYVKPTVHGSKWGLGGTCVNVGCIPKKLMHYASLMSPILHNDAKEFGWEYNMTSDVINWEKCVQTVQNTVKKLNFVYRAGLRTANVTYVNALAKFVNGDPHSLEYTNAAGETNRLTADKILIAVGGRPHIPEYVKNARELAITSDDIFFLEKPPGKTLVIGAAYIALEIAGFLTEMGFPVTVAVRSVPLRTFDRQCADKVVEMMTQMGTTFYHGCLVKGLEKLQSGQIEVTFCGTNVPPEVFDTVFYASGRKADLTLLDLESVGVKTDSDGKVITNDDMTTIPNIYAVGDCASNRLELTPVAIKAGELLVRRLYAGATLKVNYDNIATAIFTPIEYGSVGLSEEAAIAKYGEENLEIYLQQHKTLEVSASHRPKVKSTQADEFDTELSSPCLVKLVCLKTDGERIIGFHFVGPNAGEITQGFSLSMHLGAKKSDYDQIIGIHPTDAEAFCNLTITKASGEPFDLVACGGGKCG